MFSDPSVKAIFCAKGGYGSIDIVGHLDQEVIRKNPKILNGSRRKRIARGSGNSIQEINRLIKQFNEMQKMVKMMSSKGGKKIRRNFKNMRFN